MRMNPIPFRPRDEEQVRQLKMLSYFLDKNQADTLRLALDVLFDQHAEQIAAIAPEYDQAREALEAAQARLARLRQTAVPGANDER